MCYRPQVLFSRSNQALIVTLLAFTTTSNCRRSCTQAFLTTSSANPALFTTRTPTRSYISTTNPSSSNIKDTTSLAMTKKVLVPIADGSEEIETTSITDTLTRFGAHVTVASVMSGGRLECKMSRGITFRADCSIEEAVQQEWDCVALPGGMPGAEHLRDCAPLIDLVKRQKESGKWYGAICAAPAVALASHGLIDAGAAATCYPAPHFREKLPHASDDKVVVTKNLVTSQGPGTALLFALQLGEELFGKKERDKVAAGLLVK